MGCGHGSDTEATPEFCSAEMLNPGLFLAVPVNFSAPKVLPCPQKLAEESTPVLGKVQTVE